MTGHPYAEAFAADLADLCDSDPGDEHRAPPAPPARLVVLGQQTQPSQLRVTAAGGSVIVSSRDRVGNCHVHLLSPEEAADLGDRFYEVAMQADAQQQADALAAVEKLKGAHHA